MFFLRHRVLSEASPKLLKLEKWSPTEQTCSVGKFQVLDNGKQPLGETTMSDFSLLGQLDGSVPKIVKT